MSKIHHSKSLEFYLSRKYPFVVYPSKDGGYVAEIEELPGCMTQADTLEEAGQLIEEARHAWTEVAYEEGLEIPPPRTEVEHSGKFVARVPKTLHRHLSEVAAREGISLNQYVVFLLSSGVALDKIHTLLTEELNEFKKQMSIQGVFAYTKRIKPSDITTFAKPAWGYSLPKSEEARIISESKGVLAA